MLDTWSPRILSILRFVVAFLYFWHGTQKMFGFPLAAGAPAFVPLDWMTIKAASAILEVFGGALLMVGLFSRPVAFILSGHMAFAYFMAHATASTFLMPILNRGELAVLFCFVFLYIAAAGPGPWSLDAAMRRGRSP